jgi:hypothetical protein
MFNKKFIVKKIVHLRIQSKLILNCCLIILFFIATVLVFSRPLASAEIQVSTLGTYSFVSNDVDSKGVLWAGDKNFNLYKSTDNGATFQPIYRLPGVYEPSNSYSGFVWNVFVDSRDCIFVSAGGTGGLFRSNNGGANFTQVLKTNGTTNESFYISMTEDDVGSLYVVTYTNGKAQPFMLKSVDGGSTWVKVGNFSVVHFHSIKFNPFNKYLYVIMGEGSTPDAARILRSKDGGASWSLVVKRNDALGTVYLAMAFSGNYVYLGQDYPNRVCQIHRFYDDGSSSQFEPMVVYSPPSDGYMPFISATALGNALVFANSAEVVNGISRIVASADGLTWTVIKNQTVASSTDNRWNFLTVHPRSGIVFGTIKTAESYRLIDVAPAPSPTVEPTPFYVPKPTTVASTPTPHPVSTPKPTSTPLPSPTPTQQPTISAPSPTPSQAVSSIFKIDQYSMGAITAVAIMGGAVLTTALLKKKQHNKT